MDIENGTNSRKLAYLMQFIDNHDNDGKFLTIAQQLNTPEEVAQTRDYFDMTKENRFYKLINIELIVNALKYVN